MPESDITSLAEAPRPQLPLDQSAVRQAVTTGIARYCDERRARIPGFVAETYGWRGAMRLHRRAFGPDLWRSPANIMLALPYVATRAAAAGARGLGRQQTAAWLTRRQLFLTTDVAREVEWRVFADFLELPYVQDLESQTARRSERDALAEAILADPAIDAVLHSLLRPVGRRADDPAFRAWLTDAMAHYTGSRTAAVDITNALISAGVGALAFKQWTPGALTLGPMLAQALAQKLAIVSFPLGAGLGGLWYGAFPISAPVAATAAATGGVLALGALVAAFAGVIADPVQAHLGLHQRRLNKLVASLESELLQGEGESFTVRDHYVARVFDLMDLATSAYRLAMRPAG
ncbi:DUF6635 family protein [Algihabitans albus]|uniref:DUF6635 family protein n=1 Tax=Algihabitans albus TaxID=2164067 RepID=UPI000E5C7E5E|nr:DUF6635 family protein [Algihabitans albus]